MRVEGCIATRLYISDRYERQGAAIYGKAGTDLTSEHTRCEAQLVGWAVVMVTVGGRCGTCDWWAGLLDGVVREWMGRGGKQVGKGLVG